MYFLGSLQATGSLPATNQNTGASGALPFAVRSQQQIYLVPDAAGLRWAAGGRSGFSASGLSSAPLGAVDSLNGPFTLTGDAPIISVVGVAGGVVRVYAGPRQ